MYWENSSQNDLENAMVIDFLRQSNCIVAILDSYFPLSTEIQQWDVPAQ